MAEKSNEHCYLLTCRGGEVKLALLPCYPSWRRSQTSTVTFVVTQSNFDVPAVAFETANFRTRVHALPNALWRLEKLKVLVWSNTILHTHKADYGILRRMTYKTLYIVTENKLQRENKHECSCIKRIQHQIYSDSDNIFWHKNRKNRKLKR